MLVLKKGVDIYPSVVLDIRVTKRNVSNANIFQKGRWWIG